MIEDLTKKKLKEYGFDTESINRLSTWENYECFLMADRGYFWASNKEKKIYSGIEGKEKHFSKSILPQYHKKPKEMFQTFDELFRYAVSAGSITIPENKLGKEFNYSSEKNSRNVNFNIWLQNHKGWEYGNEAKYIEFLTRENWVEYLTHCDNETKELKRKAENIKEQWRPKPIQVQNPDEIKSTSLSDFIIAIKYFQNPLVIEEFGKRNELFEPFYDVMKSLGELIDIINDVLRTIKVQDFDNHVTEFRVETIKALCIIIKSLPKNKVTAELLAKKLDEIKDQELLGIIESKLPTDWQNFLKIYLTNKYEYNHQIISLPKDKSRIQTETKTGQPVEIKPVFKIEAIEKIFDILKQHFPNQTTELKNILQTGDIPRSKLFFQGSGKTLLDFFKQLMTGQFLSMAVQKDFEKWVSNGFEYLHRNNRTKITPKYASKIISGKERAAKGNRLIEIKNVSGQFEISQLEIKNREQV